MSKGSAMDFIQAIQQYIAVNEQERKDKEVILDYCRQHGNTVLSRENKIAHINSSGFIMNQTLNQVLFVHHTIRDAWSWTGGHADGDGDLLHVAVKEAVEETGVTRIQPLSNQIASIDILPVFGHIRKSTYVNAHLHLSIAYILIADEREEVHICAEENNGVRWFPIDTLTEEHFAACDVFLYQKLISFAHRTFRP